MMITDSIFPKQQEILHTFSEAGEARKKQKLHTETKKQKALQDEEKVMITRAELYQYIVNIKQNLDQLIEQTKKTDIGCSVVFAEEDAKEVMNQLDILEQYLTSRNTLKFEDISFLKDNISNAEELLIKLFDIVGKRIQGYRYQIYSVQKDLAGLNDQKNRTIFFLKNLPSMIVCICGLAIYIMKTFGHAESHPWINRLVYGIYFLACFLLLISLLAS